MLNRGLSGYNTAQARAILDGLSTKTKLQTRAVLATIFFGANDAAGPENFQAIPLEVRIMLHPMVVAAGSSFYADIVAYQARHRVSSRAQAYGANLRAILARLRQAAPGARRTACSTTHISRLLSTART